jgi:hypothetical protein
MYLKNNGDDMNEKKALQEKAGASTVYTFTCIKPDGSVRWKEENHNLVVNTGLDDILDKYFKGSAYTAAHYLGLLDGTPTIVAGDTMASHAGWVEVTGYAAATRPALTLGAVSGQSVDNSASKASYAINATVTIGGGFISTSNTKGGATGILYSAVAFGAGDRAMLSGDTLEVTATLTQSAA